MEGYGLEIREGALIQQIQQIVSDQILSSLRPDQVDDMVVAGLDSIGRLALLVALENELGVELMGADMGPEVFQSLVILAGFIMRKVDG